MNWTNLGVGGGGFAAVVAVLAALGKHFLRSIVANEIERLERKFEARFDKNDTVSNKAAEDIAKLAVDFARETGGNSHGLRQTLDGVVKDVAEMKGALGAQRSG